MKIKPLHIAIGLGAFVLLSGKKKSSTTSLDRASAMATAKAVQNATADPAKTSESELERAKDILTGHKAGEPPYGPNNIPTLYEFSMLYAIDKELLINIPPMARKGLFAQARGQQGLEQAMRATHSVNEKIQMALDLMSPSQTRNFAADCLELALPVFEKDFPRDNAAKKLIQEIRLFAAGKGTMERVQAAKRVVLGKITQTDSFRTNQHSRLRALAEAIDFATVTKGSLQGETREAMLATLRGTEDRAIKAMQRLARKEGHDYLKKNPRRSPTPYISERSMAEEFMYATEKSAVRESKEKLLNIVKRGL